MNHIHNETVLEFLKAHKDNPNVMKFIKEHQSQIDELNKDLGTDYMDYFDYLEANIGDDASFTIEELKALLKPRFEVKLNSKEKKRYDYEGFEILLDDLKEPVHIKDEGEFFSIWVKDRMDIPVRLLKKFLKFLKDNNIGYENEYEI